MAKSTKTILREIAEAEHLTPQQKEAVVNLAAEFGVKFDPLTTRCRDCYRDAALIILRRMAEIDAKKSNRKYILREGVDIIWRGLRVNQAATDKELQQYIADGLSRDYFIRINGDDGKWL